MGNYDGPQIDEAICNQEGGGGGGGECRKREHFHFHFAADV